MSYRLILSDDVKKQLKKMDKHVALMLAKDLKRTLDGIDNPRRFGKALIGKYKGLWRYRFGDYRVICDINDDELLIISLELGHRKNVYKG